EAVPRSHGSGDRAGVFTGRPLARLRQRGHDSPGMGRLGRRHNGDRPVTTSRGLLTVLALGSVLAGGRPDGPPKVAAPGPRHDRYGDPLPPGAVARLGTTRPFFHGQA